jgi:hypothetical protein
MNRISRRKHDKREPMERIASIARSQLIKAVDELIESFAGVEALGRARRSKTNSTDEGLEVELRRFQNLAEVLTQWHWNDAYLTSDGSPRPLPQDGMLSLMALARQVAETTPAAQALVSDLLELGFVEESAGGYRPAQRSAVLGKANGLNLAHAAVAATRLLRTIRHNVTGRSPRLYERQVSDVTIRAADLPIYLRFVEEQAQYLIDSADDWLARRQIGRAIKGDRIKVGIGAFVWADPAPGKSASRGLRPVRERRSRK